MVRHGLLASLLALVCTVVAASDPYAQQTGLSCTGCHTRSGASALNSVGQAFRDNGHRMPAPVQSTAPVQPIQPVQPVQQQQRTPQAAPQAQPSAQQPQAQQPADPAQKPLSKGRQFLLDVLTGLEAQQQGAQPPQQPPQPVRQVQPQVPRQLSQQVPQQSPPQYRQPDPVPPGGVQFVAPNVLAPALVGNYVFTPPANAGYSQNAWHFGTLIQNGPGYRWNNQAGVGWNLTPDLANLKLHSGPDNPYHAQHPNLRAFDIVVVNGYLTGLRFGPDLYVRNPALFIAGISAPMRLPSPPATRCLTQTVRLYDQSGNFQRDWSHCVP